MRSNTLLKRFIFAGLALCSLVGLSGCVYEEYGYDPGPGPYRHHYREYYGPAYYGPPIVPRFYFYGGHAHYGHYGHYGHGGGHYGGHRGYGHGRH